MAKAMRKTRPMAAMRKSQANASPAPAPAAIPLTAAITGFGIVASVVTIGL